MRSGQTLRRIVRVDRLNTLTDRVSMECGHSKTAQRRTLWPLRTICPTCDRAEQQ